MLFGLAQGVTSPIFYNIYTADIPKHDKCLLALFADDTSILHFKVPEPNHQWLAAIPNNSEKIYG
jgi:hypothetical protein